MIIMLINYSKSIRARFAMLQAFTGIFAEATPAVGAVSRLE
jgi:hypothetical protein